MPAFAVFTAIIICSSVVVYTHYSLGCILYIWQSRTRADPLAKWVSYFYTDTPGVIHAISRSGCRPSLQIAVSREKSYRYCRSVTTPRRTALRKSLWHMAMCAGVGRTYVLRSPLLVGDIRRGPLRTS